MKTTLSVEELGDLFENSKEIKNPDKKEKKKVLKNEVVKIFNTSQAREEIKRLNKEGAKFETYETANSVKIKILKGKKTLTYWYIEDQKTEYFLILLNKIKREMRERAETIERCKFSANPDDTKYFLFNKKAFKDVESDAGSIYEFENVYEADVSHAYYRAAYVLSFISKDLYLEITTNCSKHDRLRLLGCIAAKKLYQSYDKGELIEGATLKDDLLRDAWFKICNYIDVALMDFRSLLKKDFLFYWVDGIYFKHDTALPDILSELNYFKHLRHIKYKYDLDFKLIPIKSFKLINRGDFIEIQVEKPDGTIKPFFPPKNKVKSYSFENLNSL